MRYRKWEDLLPIEQEIRRGIPTGMTDKVLFTISYESGFERFGHYEDWGQGFVIRGSGTLETNIIASDEHLDIAIKKWLYLYERARLKKTLEEANA